MQWHFITDQEWHQAPHRITASLVVNSLPLEEKVSSLFGLAKALSPHVDQRALLESKLEEHETARSYAERSIQVHPHSFGYNTLGTILLRMAIQQGSRITLLQGIDNLERARDYLNWGKREHPFVTFFTSLIRFAETWGLSKVPEQARTAWTQWFREASSFTEFSVPNQQRILQEWQKQWLMNALPGQVDKGSHSST